MASILQVEELRGATSGANANKIIIPSGQTLDASEGFIPPSGSVVSLEQHSTTTAVENSTNTYIDAWTFTHTPKLTNSTLHFICSLTLRGYRNNGNDGRYDYRILVNDTLAAFGNEVGGYDYGGSGHYLLDKVPDNFKVANTTGGAVTVKLQIRNANQSISVYFNQASNRSSIQVLEAAGD